MKRAEVAPEQQKPGAAGTAPGSKRTPTLTKEGNPLTTVQNAQAFDPGEQFAQKVAVRMAAIISASDYTVPKLAAETGLDEDHLRDAYHGDRPWNTEQVDRVCSVLAVSPLAAVLSRAGYVVGGAL